MTVGEFIALGPRVERTMNALPWFIRWPAYALIGLIVLPIYVTIWFGVLAIIKFLRGR
jgi:hypothetical protein